VVATSTGESAAGTIDCALDPSARVASAAATEIRSIARRNLLSKDSLIGLQDSLVAKSKRQETDGFEFPPGIDVVKVLPQIEVAAHECS
jgi:hypothetical protein